MGRMRGRSALEYPGFPWDGPACCPSRRPACTTLDLEWPKGVGSDGQGGPPLMSDWKSAARLRLGRLVPGARIELARSRRIKGFYLPPQLSLPPMRCLWSGLSLHHGRRLGLQVRSRKVSTLYRMPLMSAFNVHCRPARAENRRPRSGRCPTCRPPVLARDCHQHHIWPVQGSPNLRAD